MIRKRKTIFISDLHIDASEPASAQQLIQLLSHCDASVDAVYILGDLFEMWVGDDDDTLFHQDIISALKATTQTGIPVYFMHGNRDFLVGKKFLQASSCQLIEDETCITLYGKSVLLMHGDTLCTGDVAYLKARKLARNRLLQRLFLLLPIGLRRKIAANFRAKSTRHTRSVAYEIMDVTQEEVERLMKMHHASILIHGHTHRPGFHAIKLSDANVERIVLGAWHKHPSILVFDETGACQMLDDVMKLTACN